MKTLTIKKSGVVTHGPSLFSSDEELQTHLQKHEVMGTYGSPRFSMQPFQLQPAELDENGVELSAAVFEDRLAETNPDGYEVEIADVTEQLEQERINAEALAYLSSTDWMVIRESEGGTACSQEVKALRAAARSRIIH